jgi:radical SAM superfamily enzyme YgiQ (UPF0313 family)
VKVLLVATYELGHQPAGLAALAGPLLAAGHDVAVVDLAAEPFRPNWGEGADAVVFSVPMHTATALALELARSLRPAGCSARPRLGFAGLYAPVLEGHPLLGPHDLLVAGEAARTVLDWLGRKPASSGPPEQVIELGPARLPASAPPDRRLLAPLERYATYLAPGREPVLTASVETTRGCNHSCRHCPVASVYRGRSRVVPIESVVADVAQAVELGAGHVSFADPDFLNRPRHAMGVARALHERFGELSFDATIKVEHLLRHAGLLSELRALGLEVVVSAFESTDDAVLALLRKGHTAAAEIEAVRVTRAAGIELRPSWLPFTPWTTPQSLAALLELSARADLVGSTDAVQYTIRLLLPRGSLLLDQPDPVLQAAIERARRAGAATSFGSAAWLHADATLEQLQQEMVAVVERAGAECLAAASEPARLFGELWELGRAAGLPLASEPLDPEPGLCHRLPAGSRPRLSESWFCCAEPTSRQLALVQGG